MIQPKKSGKRNIAESYNRQFSEMGPLERGLLKLRIESQDQLPEIPYTFSQDQLNSFKDEGLSPSLYADMDRLLGQSQSGFDRGFNVFARGLAKTVPAFLEPIGYGVDYVSNYVIGDIQEGEEDFRNNFNDYLKSIEEDIDAALPVYKGDIEDEPTPLSSGWWVNNGDQVIRSLGYYPYGMIAGRLLGSATSFALSRTAQSLNATKTAAQLANQGKNIERISRGTSAAFTGITQNYSEHMHSAGNVFAENKAEYAKIFRNLDPDASDEEIDKRARVKAGADAANVVTQGRWNLLFEIPTNYMLFRSPSTTRALSGIASSGAKKTAQRAAIGTLEPLQEYSEEVWTGYLEKEGARQVGIEKGYYENDYSTGVDRWAEHAMSYEGVTEGLSGLIGGGMFSAYSLAFTDGKARRVKLEQEKANAAFANDTKKYNDLNEVALFETFRANAQKGTYESMIKNFEDVKNMSAEDADKRGMDADYKEKAQRAIDKALEYEQEYNANIYLFNDPVRAEILTRSKYVQNLLNDEVEQANTALSEASVEVSKYLNAKGSPAELNEAIELSTKVEAYNVAIDKLTEEYNELSKDIKNNKDRTLDKGENGADIKARIEDIQSKRDAAVKQRDKVIDNLPESATQEQLNTIIDEGFKPGNPLYQKTLAEYNVIDANSRYAKEVDRYTEFKNNPSKLKKEANNITKRAKKVEKAQKSNRKKQKAEEKAANIKKKVEAKKQKATSNKVEGEDSTSKNIQAKEEAQVNLDDILKSGEQAPEEIKLEGEAPNVDEQLNKVISQGDIESMEAYQAMLEGQLSPEQEAALQESIQNKKTNKETAKKNKVEENSNTAEVASAAVNDKTIGENSEGDRQVKNFNYQKNEDGSIPYEAQSGLTEEQDKKQLTKETKDSVPNNPKTRIGIRTKQIIDGANAMAYLAVDYVSKLINTPSGEIFVRQTASKDKTKTLVPEVESPNFLQKGAPITLRTVKPGSKGVRYVYDNLGMPKEITWQYSDFVQEAIGAIPAEINANEIPIEIVATVQGEEKVIGYVHDTNWVDAQLATGQARNIVEEIKDQKGSFDNWSYQKAEIRSLRKNIIDAGGEVTTTISEVASGTPFLNVVFAEDGTPTGKTEWEGVKSLMPGWRDLSIAFRKVGGWRTNSSDRVDDFIINDKEYSDGRIGLVLPTKKKGESFVAPLWTKPLNTSQINTIMYAATALENPATAKSISDALGFDFSKKNASALYTFVNRIAYTNSFEFDPKKPNETVYFDVNPKNNAIMIATEGNRVIYTNKPDSIPANLDITKSKVLPIQGNEAAVRKILQTVLPSLNINKANVNESYTDIAIAEDGTVTPKKYESYNEYAFELVQTNINGTNSFTDANGQQEYVYINQPVIQFSKDFKSASKPKPVAKKESVKPNQVSSTSGLTMPFDLNTEGQKTMESFLNQKIKKFNISPGKNLQIQLDNIYNKDLGILLTGGPNTEINDFNSAAFRANWIMFDSQLPGHQKILDTFTKEVEEKEKLPLKDLIAKYPELVTALNYVFKDISPRLKQEGVVPSKKESPKPNQVSISSEKAEIERLKQEIEKIENMPVSDKPNITGPGERGYPGSLQDEIYIKQINAKKKRIKELSNPEFKKKENFAKEQGFTDWKHVINSLNKREGKSSGTLRTVDRFLKLTEADILQLASQSESVKAAKALREKESISSNQVINIYAGTNENTELSNFAERKIRIEGGSVRGVYDASFRTPEGAFQATKIEYTTPGLYTTIEPFSKLNEKGKKLVKKLQNATGAEAKRLGKQIEGLNTANWDERSEGVMEDILFWSFEQNPDAEQKLLATGNATLTHTQDKSKWGKLFPKILMEIRKDLQDIQAYHKELLEKDPAELKEYEKSIVKGLRKEYGLREKDSKESNQLDPNTLFQDLIDDADYDLSFSLVPQEGAAQPEIPFEAAEEELKVDNKISSRLEPLFIDFANIDFNRQKEILNFTTYHVTKDFLADENISVDKALENAKNVFVKVKNLPNFDTLPEIMRRDISIIIDKWDKVSELTKEQLKSTMNIKEGSRGNKKDLEKNNFNDEARWQSNPKKKASERIKIKMSQIVKRNRDGSLKLNYLKLPTFYTFDEVWGNIKGILSESLPNIDSMLQQLNDKSDTNPMYREIAKYINSKLTEQEKSEFVSEFANAYISQRVTMFSKDKNGNFKAEIIDSAANKESNVIKDRWLTEQFSNPNLVKFSEDGEAYIDSDYVASVEKNYREQYDKISKDSKYKSILEKNSSDEMADLVHSTLTSLSITVPPEAIKYMATPVQGTNRTIGDEVLDQAWGFAVDPKSRLGLMGLIFSAYKNNAPKKEDVKYDPEVQDNAKPLFKNNPLKGGNFQGIILKLAEVTAKFGDPIYSISYRDGEGKTVYPYNGTTSMHVLLKLYENYDNDDIAKSLVDGMMSTHMGSVSRLLPKIIKNKNVLKVLYADALKDKFGNENSASKRKHQGILQQDLNSCWLFQNSNKKKALFFGVTKADRGISELIEHDKINFKDQVIVENGVATKILKTAEDYLYSYAMGEIKRIYSTQSKIQSDPEYLQKTKYREGSQYFHFFSFLNKHELDKTFEEQEVNQVYPSEGIDGIPMLDITNSEPVLRRAINLWATNIINESVEQWNELGIVEESKTKLDSGYMDSLGKERSVEDKAVVAAGDLELNYIISNIEQQILFGGDLAEAYNGKGSTAAAKIASGRTNYQKRLIGSDAPKTQGNYTKREYSAVTFNDRLSFSENYKYYDKLFGGNSPYGSPTNKSIESTDALELTTVQEHIDMLEYFGQISTEMHTSISKKIDNAIKDENNSTNYYELTEQEMAFALKPVKPQYDFMHPDPSTGRLSRVYRKSMSLPMLPDMTSDMQLDNIRIAMENTGVQRTGHATSDKLSPFSRMNAYDSDGNVLSVEKLMEGMKSSKFTLFRDGLGIQQEKNVKDSQLIKVSTQKLKVMFTGLLEEEFTIDEETKTGEEARARKQEIISQIYKIKHDKFLKKYGNIVENADTETLAVQGSEIQLSKLVEALKEEAKARNWSINDVFSLDLKEDGSGTIVPLPFIQSRKMLEGLMLSIVNKITDIKMPGITFVQSSSAGFKATGAWSELKGNMRNQLITTTSFDESKGLQGPRWDAEKNEVIPGQVMVKFFYKDEDGNELDIQAKDSKDNYIFLFEKNGRLFLNPNKVPKEVRQLIGYRIPYQNIGSEMPLEIVGFLPSNMELTVIVPDEMLPQMGSDFDVDTLNTLMSQYIVNKNENGEVKGVYRRDRKKYPNKFTDENLLLDELRDIFWTVLTTNKKSFDMMSKGIDDPALENIADDVDSILNKNTRTRTAISRIDQIKDNISQRAGQVLIGPGAQANTLNAIMEGMNIYLVEMKKKKQIKRYLRGFYGENKNKKGEYFKELRFSNLSNQNETVYYENDVKKTRTSSDVINITMNAAIDNANKPTLGKLYFTMDTLPTALFMAQGGINIENIGYMFPQEIMRDYTRELEKIVPGLSDKNVFDRKAEAVKIVQSKYQELSDVANVKEIDSAYEEYTDKSNAAFKMLFQSKLLKKELIIGAPNSGLEKTKEYYRKQLVIFEQFLKFEEDSNRLNKPRKAVNDPSVKGLGSTMASAKSYINRFEVFKQDKASDEAAARLTGLSGLANTEYANLAKYLESAFNLFANVYPVSSDFMSNFEEVFLNNTDSTEVSENVMSTIFDAVVANGWSYAIEQVFVRETQEATSLYELRRKLFVEDNNIAVQTIEAQKTDWGKTNEFVMALKPVLSTNKNKGKSAVTVDWSSNIENLAMQRGFTALLLGSVEAQEFGKNLIIAAYLNGGTQKASSYLSMIPFGGIEKLGLNKHLSNDMFKSEAITDTITYLKQVLQHKPWLATSIDMKNSVIKKYAKFRVDPNKTITGLVMPTIEEANNLEAFSPFIYISEGHTYYKEFLVYPVGKTYYLFSHKGEIEGGNYYERIDLKGDKFGTEYDYSGNTASYLEENKVIKTIKDPIPTGMPSVGVPWNEEPFPEGEQLGVPEEVLVGMLEEYENRKPDYENQLDNLLDRIITDGKEGTVELAKLLKTKGIYKSVPFKGVVYSDAVKQRKKEGEPTKYILGSYNNAKFNITVYEGSFQAAKATKAFRAETFLHETVHYFTVAALVGKDTSVHAKRFKRAMDAMLVKAKSEFETNPTYKQNRTTREENRNARIAYALTNPKELVAGMAESKYVQEFLNNIIYQKDQNLFEKIKNLIKTYYKALAKQLGFDVREGSALDVGLNEMLMFLQLKDAVVEEQIAEENQRTPEKDTGELAGILGGATLVMDSNGNPTGEVIVTSPEQTPVDKVQQAAQDVKELDKIKVQEEIAAKAEEVVETVEVVSRYTNADVKANPDKIYVFGDNTQRKGTGGQAQIRNNENAFGIATKLQPNNSAAAFMSDNDLQSNKDVIDSDIAKIKADGRELVFPKDGFGTGLAKLKEKAPQTYTYLKQRLLEEFRFNNDTGAIVEEKSFSNEDRQILEERRNAIDYTADQEKALLMASDFINNDSTSEMLLAGYAGTGKTTIIENIIKYAESVGKNIIVTAPTNKAALVINQKLKLVGLRSVEATTNHGFLTGEPDADSGRFELDYDRFDDMDLENSIHIMDEASMLSNEMLQNLRQVQDLGLKSIYIGDGFQLPPVLSKGDVDPKIFEKEYSHKIEMTEVKRQVQDNPVLTVATNMRNTKSITIPSESVPNFKVTSTVDAQTAWLTELKQDKDVIMITSGNPDRIKANNQARAVLFGPDADIIEDGEILISVANSSEVDVISEFGKKSNTVANSEILGRNKDKTYTKHPKQPEKAVIYMPAYTPQGEKQRTTALTVQAVLDEKGNTIILFPDAKDASIVHQQINKVLFGKKPWDRLKDPVQAQETLDFFEPFLVKAKVQGRVQKVVPKSVILAYYGYAITGHKSQGSQWETVYVNHNWSGQGKFDPTRWLYTAITRAEKNVTLMKAYHHTTAPLASIRNAVNHQAGPVESKQVVTPQDQKSYESVLEVATRYLPIYNDYIEMHGKDKVLKAIKNNYETVQAFQDEVDKLIHESGATDYSIVSDSMDMPVNAKGEIAEIIQGLNGRIKSLQRRKTLALSVDKRIYIDSQIEALKEDVERLKEGNNTFVIEDVAIRQLDWAKNILDRPQISLQEIKDANRLVDIWSFKNTKHLLSEAQAEDKNNPTRKVFAQVGAIAEDVGLTLAAKTKKWVKSYVENQSGEPLTDDDMAFLNMEDEGWFRGNFIDAAGFTSPIARATDGALKTVARNAEDATLNTVLEIQKRFKDLNKELESLGLSTDIFLQKDDEGKPTGYFASKFKESYYKERQRIHELHGKQLKSIMSSTRLTPDQIKRERYESFASMYDAKNGMEIAVDIRFWVKDTHSTSDAKSKKEYIEYLNKTIGEGSAQDIIGQAEDGLARYNLEENAHKRKVAADLAEGVIKPAIGMTLTETAAAIHKRWVNKNNPEFYLEQRYNTTPTNITFGTAGYKYTVTHPKVDMYINEEFSTIENNKELSSFYAFYTDKMSQFKSYLPEVAVNGMSENFFPSIQKDLLEEYSNKGIVAALSYLGKDTQLYGALFADETLGLNRENEGLKAELDERGVPISKVPLRFLGSEDVALEDRAFDLERVMVMFAGMSVNYKFKSEAEPLVNILMRTVREATKPYLDSSGKKIKRWGTNKNITIKSGPQVIQEALDYSEQAIMYGRSREQVGKTSLELPGSLSTDMRARYRKAKDLKKEYDQLNDDLVDGKITQAQFNAEAELLENDFKELDIKAFSFHKLIRGFISYTQLKGLGWNASAGIANVGFGMLASVVHASGEEDFTSGQLAESLAIMLRSATNTSASKAGAIMKRMNVLFEMRDITYGKGDVRGKKKFKFLGKLSPMYIQQSTEFIVQGMGAVAKMINTPVTDLQGNVRNLYEAFNADGTWNVNEFGYQKEWDFNNLGATTKNSYTKFRDATIEMNKKLHGNYDPNSLTKIKSKDINLLFTMFRTWAFEGFNARYSKKVWNDQLGRYTKGRYNSIFDVGIKSSSKILMKLLMKRVTRQSSESILSGVDDNIDAINLKKTLSAIKVQATILALGIMLKSLAEGTDDDDPIEPLLMASINILYRVEQDLSYYRSPTTFISVFKDPTPALKTIFDFTRAVDGTQRYMLKDNYRGDHPLHKWAKVFPFTNQIYKWTVITEKDLDTSYGMSDWIEQEYFNEDE